MTVYCKRLSAKVGHRVSNSIPEQLLADSTPNNCYEGVGTLHQRCAGEAAKGGGIAYKAIKAKQCGI